MYCMIEVAFDNEEEANKVIGELLKNRLVSSCQLVKSKSKWRWNNEIEMCDEFLMFLKTRKELTRKIYEVVKSIHSYECFEFAIIDISSDNKDYLNWIERETSDINE